MPIAFQRKCRGCGSGWEYRLHGVKRRLACNQLQVGEIAKEPSEEETLQGSGSASGEGGITVVEDRWDGELQAELLAPGAELGRRVGCVEAFNIMRGCPLSFSIYVMGKAKLDASCAVAPANVCKRPVPPLLGNVAASRCY